MSLELLEAVAERKTHKFVTWEQRSLNLIQRSVISDVDVTNIEPVR